MNEALKYPAIKTVLLCIVASVMLFAVNAQAAEDQKISDKASVVCIIDCMDMPAQDIERFVADWNERAKTAGQAPGFITATLYRSLIAGARYQIINVSQWQSYDAWVAANNNPVYASQLSQDGQTAGIKRTRGFYRPAAWSTNTYSASFEGDKQPSGKKGAPLQRAQKDPEIKYPESPFVFINLMEMETADTSRFIADWQVRSKVMGQMPAAMGSTLYKSLLPGTSFQVVNVSQWQSYNGFIDANNDPTYAQELTSDLGHTPSIKLTRGFYRPVASSTHIYQ